MKIIVFATVLLLVLVTSFFFSFDAQAETFSWKTADLDYGFINGLDDPYRFNNSLSGSLALDSLGNPHINFNGKYAVWTGTTWETQTIGFTGQLVLDKNGNPHICYCAGKYYNQDSGLFLYDVFYASLSGSSWINQTVASQLYPYAYPSFAFDVNGNPHVSYMRGDTDLMYASQNGSDWSSQVIDNQAWKTSTHLTFDSNNNAHIAYANEDYSTFSVASQTGTSWIIQKIEGVFTTVSVAVDLTGNPHIFYLYNNNASNPVWRYASWNGSNWEIQTLPSVTNYFPSYSSLAVDSSGKPHLCFWTDYSDSRGFLVYASYNGTSWDIQQVENQQIGSGLSITLTLDSADQPHLLYSYQGRTTQRWGYTIEQQYYQTYASLKALPSLTVFPSPAPTQTPSQNPYYPFQTFSSQVIREIMDFAKIALIGAIVTVVVVVVVVIAVFRRAWKPEIPAS
jgi:hypothetical protein